MKLVSMFFFLILGFGVMFAGVAETWTGPNGEEVETPQPAKQETSIKVKLSMDELAEVNGGFAQLECDNCECDLAGNICKCTGCVIKF